MKGIAKGVYPIDTGKVLIGRDYVPKHVHYTTEAELFWQGVLLGRESVRPSLSTSVKRWGNIVRAVERYLSNLFRRTK